ncbi:MAG: diaminopimelate decarboxylase [Pseudoxanthomonas sp.]
MPVTNDNGRFDGVDLQALAVANPTPFYAYSASAIRQRIDELRNALSGLDAQICFAVKANPSHAILQLMAQAGLGADIVSVGELRRSLRAGIAPELIVFSGVGKTESEMEQALACNVGRFNLESLDELEGLQRVAQQLGVIARASVRINPDVDALTHAKISTGRAENKFGVSIEQARQWFERSSDYPAVRLDGLHVHIGSQLLDLAPVGIALQRVADFWRELDQSGHALDCIDIGGGLGVVYRQGHDTAVDLGAYADVVRKTFADFQGRLMLEPGRYLVAEAGILLTRVIRVKQGDARAFLIVDAAMNDLMRPSLYEAWHDIERIQSVEANGSDLAPMRYDVVGPVCESSDVFASGRLLPPCKAGDLLAILCTGAYGASMSSTYNSRPLAVEVMVDEGRYAIIRRPQTFDEMIAGEQSANAWKAT